jgi:hypothetical protein
MKCKKHPRYQAKRPPRADCEACRQIWKEEKQLYIVRAGPKPSGCDVRGWREDAITLIDKYENTY